MTRIDDMNESSSKFQVSKKVIISAGLILGLIFIDFGIKTWEAVNLVTAVEKSEEEFLNFKTEVKDANLVKFLSLTESTAKETFVSGVSIERLRILPWHLALSDARDDYLKHNAAWYQRLSTTRIEAGSVAADGGEDINPTWQQSRISLPACIPSPDVFSLRERVDKIIAN
jgi:hypothetical protein